MEDCMICERIDWIKNGKNPYFVKELSTGYVVIGDHQRIKGYSLFLCKEHAAELHFLEPAFRDQFLHEMAVVAEAVYNAFHPDKLNYELLGRGNGAGIRCISASAGRTGGFKRPSAHRVGETA